MTGMPIKIGDPELTEEFKRRLTGIVYLYEPTVSLTLDRDRRIAEISTHGGRGVMPVRFDNEYRVVEESTLGVYRIYTGNPDATMDDMEAECERTGRIVLI